MADIAFNTDIIMSMVTAAKSRSGVLQPTGMVLLSLAFLGQLTANFYSWWVTGGADKLVAALLRLAIMTALPLAALLNWGAAGMLIPNFFTNEIAVKVGGGDDFSQFQKLGNVFNRVAKAIETRQSSPQTPEAPNPVYPATGGSIRDGTKEPPGTAGASSMARGLISSITGLNLDLKDLLVALITGIILSIGTAALMIVYAFVLYGNLLILYAGVIFGPLLVAVFPLNALSHMAKSWVNFMVATGLTYAVAVVLAAISSVGLNQIIASIGMSESALLPAIPGPGDSSGIMELPSIAAALIGMSLMIFMAWLMTRADNIAQGMASGSGGGSGGGFFAVATRIVRVGAGKGSGGGRGPRP